MATTKESKKSTKADKTRRRFSISSPPNGIGGMGSQYHPRGGLSQPIFKRSGTYREPIEIEIERARYKKVKTIIK